jgi:sulfite reductase beta subunit-like hemoprotein
MGLSAAIQERIDSLGIEDPLTRQINIKMSGCPNGCGQHHIANIGFTGASIKVGSRTVPAYIPHIAGSFDGGTVALGRRLKARLPAKRVPDAIERWLDHYRDERLDGEPFTAFVERTGTARLEELVADLSLPPEFSLETMEHFIDWSRAEPFQVIRGEGECAV